MTTKKTEEPREGCFSLDPRQSMIHRNGPSISPKASLNNTDIVKNGQLIEEKEDIAPNFQDHSCVQTDY